MNKHEELRSILIKNGCPEVGDVIIDEISKLFGHSTTTEDIKLRTYHVNLTINDCTSVDAETEEEAKQIATDIFKESGYDLSRPFELEVEEGQDD